MTITQEKNLEEMFLGQSSLISQKVSQKMRTIPLTIVGAGATGGSLILSLSKTGTGFRNITLIDFDLVEPKNYGNQVFGVRHFGRKKIACVQELTDFIGLEGDFKFVDAKYIHTTFLPRGESRLLDLLVPK